MFKHVHCRNFEEGSKSGKKANRALMSCCLTLPLLSKRGADVASYAVIKMCIYGDKALGLMCRFFKQTVYFATDRASATILPTGGGARTITLRARVELVLAS